MKVEGHVQQGVARRRRGTSDQVEVVQAVRVVAAVHPNAEGMRIPVGVGQLGPPSGLSVPVTGPAGRPQCREREVESLLSDLTTSVSIYAIQAAGAVALAPANARVACACLALARSVVPGAQEPLDRTPITPTETVGAATYEPF